MKEIFCNVEYLHVAVVVLFLALLAQGAGRGLGVLVGPLLKKLSGKNGVTVNVGEGKGKGGVCKVNPEDCMAHQAEHERSLKNEREIGNIWSHINLLRTEVRSGHQRILMALVASGNIKPEHIPKEE